jgi:hypothetical protein
MTSMRMKEMHKINVVCVVSKEKIMDLPFLLGKTVTDNWCLGMLTWLLLRCERIVMALSSSKVECRLTST